MMGERVTARVASHRQESEGGADPSAAAARPVGGRRGRGATPGHGGLTVLAVLAATLLVVFLAVPLVALLLRAADGGGFTPATRRTLRPALTLSLATTTVTLLVVVALGTPLAYLLARRRFRGARLVDTLVDLPIVLPPAVAGIALLVAFGRRGVVGEWLDRVGVTLGFTTAAVVLAQVFVAVPFYVRAAKAGFGRVDRDLEDAAADLGATPFRVFWSVTLPLARPSLAAGAVLAWARALSEFGATIMFAGSFPGRTQTMPLAIYNRYGANDLDGAILLSLVLLVTSLLVLLGIRLLGDRTAHPTA